MFGFPDYTIRRDEMVETQLRARGITDKRVLAAVRSIRREEFVPEEARDRAYGDEPIPIGFGQTISQPWITAYMAQTLALTGGENILDVGAGSGYHAALLGRLAGKVTSIEIIPELVEYARENLARTGLDQNVTVIRGDGGAGAPDGAPFDAISVAAGAPEVPAHLLDQLKDSGRLVIPVGPLEDQELRLIVKQNGKVESRVVGLCRFVPLRGQHGWR